jgi:hypothetical protein
MLHGSLKTRFPAKIISENVIEVKKTDVKEHLRF